MKFLYVFFLLTLLFIFPQYIIAQDAGPKTEKVDISKYSKVYYVSSETGSDTIGNGTMNSPWRTITHAFVEIKNATKQNLYAVEVAEGKYNEPTIHLKEYIDIYGGFNVKKWDRDIFTYETVLEGNGKHRIAFGNNNTKIDGFTFRGGVVKGQGAAIDCQGVSPVISNNFFRTNKTLGPDNWKPKYWHEQANDGGAICCSDGSSPTITNNVFYKNNTENGRGAGIAMNNKCGGEVINNVFIGNVSGLNDPARSSDGGAVAVFRWSHPLIANNIIIGNKSLASNDAGGVWVALWCSPVIKKNVFLDNQSGDDAGALFVGGQEHRYDKPLDQMPSKDKFYVTIDGNVFMGNKNPSNNSGVTRFTMESRGIFENNLCAYNNGVYFQRCEAEIVNNTMLENLLLIETKADLKGNQAYNNIIWGGMEIDAPAVFSHNDSKEILKGDNNISKDPMFKNDAFQIIPFSTAYNPFKFITTIFVSGGKYKTDELKGRIVKTGDKWGVVKSNTSNNIEVWNDLSGNTEIQILPSFQLLSDSPCLNTGMNVKEDKSDISNGSGEPNIGVN